MVDLTPKKRDNLQLLDRVGGNMWIQAPSEDSPQVDLSHPAAPWDNPPTG